MCVCVFVTVLTATYIILKSKVRYHRGLHGVLNICNVWLSLKRLMFLTRKSSCQCYKVLLALPLLVLWSKVKKVTDARTIADALNAAVKQRHSGRK